MTGTIIVNIKGQYSYLSSFYKKVYDVFCCLFSKAVGKKFN